MNEQPVQTVDEQDVGRPSLTLPTLLSTPTHTHRHSALLRGIDAVTPSEALGGRFGRMFRNVPVFAHNEEDLVALAQKMISPEGAGDEDENPELPAGYTYLGQFVDHDITFDPASSLQRQDDPDALHNFRTPRFDLDSLYGEGPADQPYLYRHDAQPVPHPRLPNVDLRGSTFLLGEFVDSEESPFAGPDLPRNLPRSRPEGRALIGDPRNDENLIVSQLHVVFLKFHNKVIEFVADETPLRDENLFKESQRLVRWHYQWAVIHDFLPRIVGDEVVNDILRSQTYRVSERKISIVRPRLLFYRHCGRPPFIPIEWSVAAYRFGHSMIRETYFFNDFVKNVTGTGDNRTPIFKASPESELDQLNGFRRLPDRWGFEWKFFFDVEAGFNSQRALKIDSKLARSLGDLPPQIASNPSSLAERNLRRGLRLGVPSGQTVARAMGIEPLSSEQLDVTDVAPDLAVDTPLWYYILKEAETISGGRKLGPVGGRIVAEVLIGLLAGDPLSFLNVAPSFAPGPPFTEQNEEFGMPELIRFATN